ncbi:ornithine carbamoyltransferase [Candidatus Micrarchaeota archaeon]|nr:ornithine carbamoyltransferase [Candidatus Micrarchaeota archaeon]MBU1930630.1 ornithine carbamoyltransferase [Candidatus Micrarchaeota archaeon]
MRHFLSLKDLTAKELEFLIKKAIEIKKKPQKFSQTLKQKTLLMFFEQPSVRTRVSFETAMTQLGGHGIFYDIKESTLGKKETISDFAQSVSRYCDLITARIAEHSTLQELANASSIPVINAMSNLSHPCQGLADFQTMLEHKGKLKGLNVAYVGDANENVLDSLLIGGVLLGMNVSIGCPKQEAFRPKEKIMELAGKLAKDSGGKVFVAFNPIDAIQNADIVYTDSWMSYHIPESEAKERTKILKPFQVNEKLLQNAPKGALFMHNLPAHRGFEVTDEILDSKRSIVFDQAENRLHAQKALLVWLLEQNKKNGR